MKYLFLLFLVCFLCSSSAQSECTDPRFKDKIFESNIVLSDIQYGSNTNNVGEVQDLFLDVYMPDLSDDTMKARPVVLLMHGGAFIIGSKTEQTVKLLGNELSKRGYVAVAVQYRLERTTLPPDGSPLLEFANKINWYRAIIRSVHDIKGAIRYLKYTVAESGNPFGIDTNNITLYGSSAGAIGALHAVFLDESDELSGSWRQALTTLGGNFEGNTSTHLQYGSTNTVRNLIADSGALGEIDWIGGKKDVDVMALHYDADETVPYNHGCFYVIFCHLNKFYGTEYYIPELEKAGARVGTYILSGTEHPVINPNMTAEPVEKIIDFLYESQCKYYNPDTTITTGINKKHVTDLKLYPNPNQGLFRIELTELNPETFIRIHSLSGQMVKEVRVSKRLQEIQLDVPEGVYFVTLQDNTGVKKVSKLIISR